MIYSSKNRKYMPLPPQKFREAVLQILYSQDFVLGSEEIIPLMMEELKTTRKAMLEAQAKVNEILVKLPEIDLQITQASTEYTFERISRVEKAILRLGLFEILFDPSIPPRVAIAEAVRLCRKFGTPESSQFVNAILDGVYKKHVAPAPKEPLPV
jgi:N utilization substance protein B